MTTDPERVDGVPMRTFTATHTDMQGKMARRVAHYLRLGLNRSEACRLARVSRQWSYDNRGLIEEFLRARKAG